MPTSDVLDLKVKLVKELARKDATADLAGAATTLDGLLEAHRKAVEGQDAAEAERIAGSLVELADSASALAAARTVPTKGDKWWPRLGMFVLFVVFGGLILIMFLYMNGVGLDRLSTIEGTRPLLVAAAIISTISFGGSLLLGSLFSGDGTFEERFRHSREVFLVFSGIFGTVVGFYFGAGKADANRQAESPAPAAVTAANSAPAQPAAPSDGKAAAAPAK